MATVRGEIAKAYAPVANGGWFEKLTRIGIASKGLVYVILGLLAFMAAAGYKGEVTSKEGVVERIANAPMGAIMLVILVLGLFAYSAWRLIAAFKDTEHKGSDTKGLGKRFGYVASGVVYGGLALTALQTLRGRGSKGGDHTQSWAARLLDLPMGELILGILGVVIIGVGIAQIRTGYLEKFRKHLRGGETEWNIRAGKAGHIARGFVFCLIGVFIIVAAMQNDASEAKGLEGTLDALAQRAYGSLLLALTGLGLAAYGAYMFLEAKYRSVRF
jgi:hypothetical protein